MIFGCEGLADYHCGLHSLEVPVNSGTRLHHSACTFATHFDGEQGTHLRAKDWTELQTLSSAEKEVSSALGGASPDDKEEVSSDCSTSCLDTEGIALYIDLACSPSKDSAGFACNRSPEIFRGTEEKSEIAVSVLPRGSHEQFKMTSQGEVSQISEPSIALKLGSHVLRTLLETENVQKLKRWRQVTPIDQVVDRGSVGASEVREQSESHTIKMSTSPAPGGSAGNGAVKEAISAIEAELRMSKDQLQTSDMGNGVISNSDPQARLSFRGNSDAQVRVSVEADVACSNVDDECPSQTECLRSRSDSELFMQSYLSYANVDDDHLPRSIPDTPHASRAILDMDDVQKFKRRRVTTFPDVAVKDARGPLEKHISNPVRTGIAEHPAPDESQCHKESIMTVDSGRLAKVGSPAVQCGIEVDTEVVVPPESVSGGAFRTNKMDICHDFSKEPPSAQNVDKDDVEETTSKHVTYARAPPDGHGSKKKEWLGHHPHYHHHHLNVPAAAAGISPDEGFVGNIGDCFRSAIDKRPAAAHPGFVGDGTTMQFCRICGLREDATSSLICDSCEEVFHMTCVNTRMKIIPRVDEWLCRPCKKKRKMNKENEQQGDYEPGSDLKVWWREDSGVGRVERELVRMSNGRRVKVRIGPKYQAFVPDWTEPVEEVDLEDTPGEASSRFGQEVALTPKEKQLEQEQAKYKLAHDIWPKGWLPANQLPPGVEENWLRCTYILYEEGEAGPDGQTLESDIICGKWRRAPLDVEQDDDWECSCALVWDPRHADCAVPQELPTEVIRERMKFLSSHDQGTLTQDPFS